MSTGATTEYAGNFIYEDGELKFFSHPEGYTQPDQYGKFFDYVYQYKDHLGNIRLTYADSDGNGSIDPSTEIISENNYYPFGLKHKGYNSNVSANSNSVASKFKYNGIEYEEALGLDLYEMDMRQYDPAIARWTSIDPVTHYSMSTYTAFDNNPVFYADPSGADSEPSGTGGTDPEEAENTELDVVEISGSCAPNCGKSQSTTGSWGIDALTYGSFHTMYSGSRSSYDNAYPDYAGLSYNEAVLKNQREWGEYHRGREAVFAAEAEAERKRMLAMHLMNFGQFYIMINGVQSVDVKVPKMRIGARQGILTPMNANNPNSFRGVSAKQVKQHLEKQGWVPQPSNPNKMYNQGTIYKNGVKGEQIRIMPGGKTRSIPNRRGPHMVHSMGGKSTVIPLRGNPTLN